MKLRGLLSLVLAVATLALSGPGVAASVNRQQDVLVGQVSLREVATGWVGVGFDSVASGDSTLVLVTSVYPESPAARAGLRRGDRVVRVNGTRVSFPMIQSIGPRIQPGDPYTFAVLRRGEMLEFPVVAERRPGSSEILVTRMQSQLDTVRMLIEVTLDSLHSAAQLPQLQVRTQEATDEGLVTLLVSAATAAEAPTSPSPPFPATAEYFTDADLFSDVWVVRDSTHTLFPPRDVHAVRVSEPGRAVFVREPGVVSAWTAPNQLDAYAAGARRVAGAALSRVSEDLGRYLGVERGLFVTDVAPGTPAARTGLEPGDVVLAVNDAAVESLATFRKLLTVPADRWALTVQRRGTAIELELRR